MSSKLANLLAGTAAKPSGKSEGIIVADPSIVALAVPFQVAKRDREAAESREEQAKLALLPVLRRYWLTANYGKPSPESTVRLVTPEGKLSASFAAQWYPAEGADLVKAGVPAECIRERMTLTLKGDLIPQDKIEAVVADLLAVLQKHGCVGALSSKLTPYPTEDFATVRHVRLTPEQNEALEVGGLNTRVSFR